MTMQITPNTAADLARLALALMAVPWPSSMSDSVRSVDHPYEWSDGDCECSLCEQHRAEHAAAMTVVRERYAALRVDDADIESAHAALVGGGRAKWLRRRAYRALRADGVSPDVARAAVSLARHRGRRALAS